MIIDTDLKIQSKPSNKYDNKLSPIKCIFFCEFNNTTGRELKYQV